MLVISDIFPAHVFEKIIDKVSGLEILLLIIAPLLLLVLLTLARLRKYAESGRSVTFFGISIGENNNAQSADSSVLNRNSEDFFLEIDHVSLPVSDLWKAKNFYTRILKLKEIQRPAVFENLFQGAWFELPNGQQLHLVLKPSTYFRDSKLDFEGSIPPDIHFALRMTSKKFNELRREIIQSPDMSSDRWAEKLYPVKFAQMYILDPSNNIIEITDIEKV